MTISRKALIAAFAMLSTPAFAQGMGIGTGMGQPGAGPVVRSCQAEIARYCEGVQHITPQGPRGGVRTCLMNNRAKLSPACRAALTSTGPGSRRGMGRGDGRHVSLPNRRTHVG